MQTQDRVTTAGVEAAIKSSQNYLLSIQNPAGYWWAELESNVTITAEVVLLHKIWGSDQTRAVHKVEAYLRSQQREHGGWERFYGDGGVLATQRSDGTWDEPEFTVTGFPGHFYLKYHLYQQHFPLTALGRYQATLRC